MKDIATLYFLTLIFSFSTCLHAQSALPWSKDRKLMWSDFKAVPNEEILAYALTAYKIEILPSDVMVDSRNNIQNYKSLTVVANFYMKHSWVHTKSDFLLAHEQLHFDIAGLYAYKMRMEFNKLKKQKISNFETYLKVYQKLWAECGKTQKVYDTETNHGQRIEENTNWIAKITKKLTPIE
jgi:hypothetical protein